MHLLQEVTPCSSYNRTLLLEMTCNNKKVFVSVIYYSASHNIVEFDLFWSSLQWTNPGRIAKQIPTQKNFIQKSFFLPKKLSSTQKSFKKAFFFCSLAASTWHNQTNFTLRKTNFLPKKTQKKFFFFTSVWKDQSLIPLRTFLYLAKKPILNNKEDNPNRFILFLTGYSGKQEGLVYLNTYFAINCWILLTLMTF